MLSMTCGSPQPPAYSFSNPPLSPSERGAVLIEFSITAWIFALFITMTVDMGQMLHSYMMLSQLSFEGARAASMVDGLTKAEGIDRYPTVEEVEQCRRDMASVPHVSELPCSLFLSQFRMRQAIDFTEMSDSLEDFRAHSSFDGSANVTVELSASYRALFLPLRLITLRSSTTLPYVVLGAHEEVKKNAHF